MEMQICREKEVEVTTKNDNNTSMKSIPASTSIADINVTDNMNLMESNIVKIQDSIYTLQRNLSNLKEKNTLQKDELQKKTERLTMLRNKNEEISTIMQKEDQALDSISNNLKREEDICLISSTQMDECKRILNAIKKVAEYNKKMDASNKKLFTDKCQELQANYVNNDYLIQNVKQELMSKQCQLSSFGNLGEIVMKLQQTKEEKEKYESIFENKLLLLKQLKNQVENQKIVNEEQLQKRNTLRNKIDVQKVSLENIVKQCEVIINENDLKLNDIKLKIDFEKKILSMETNQKESYHEKLEKSKQQNEKYKQEIQEKQNQYEIYQNEVVELKNSLKDIETNIQELSNENKELVEKVEAAKRVQEENQNEVISMKEMLNKLSQIQLDKERHVFELQERISTKQNNADMKLKENLTELCIQNSRDLAEMEQEFINEKIKLENKIEISQNNITKINEAHALLTSTHVGTIEELKNKEIELNVKVTELNSQLEAYSVEYKTLMQQNNDKMEIMKSTLDQKTSEVEENKEQLKNIRKEMNDKLKQLEVENEEKKFLLKEEKLKLESLDKDLKKEVTILNDLNARNELYTVEQNKLELMYIALKDKVAELKNIKEIKQAKIPELLKQLDELNNEHRKCIEDFKNIKEENDKHGVEIQSKEIKLSELEEEIKKFKIEFEQLESNLKSLRMSNKEETEQLQLDHDTKLKTIESSKLTEKNIFMTEYESLKVDRENLKKRKHETLDKLRNLKRQKEEIVNQLQLLVIEKQKLDDEYQKRVQQMNLIQKSLTSSNYTDQNSNSRSRGMSPHSNSNLGKSPGLNKKK